MNFISFDLILFHFILFYFTSRMILFTCTSIKPSEEEKFRSNIGPRSQIPDPRSQIPDPSSIPDPRSQIPVRYQIPERGPSKGWDTGILLGCPCTDFVTKSKNQKKYFFFSGFPFLSQM